MKSAENGYTMTLRSWNRVSRASRIAILWQIIVGFHNVTAWPPHIPENITKTLINNPWHFYIKCNLRNVLQPLLKVGFTIWRHLLWHYKIFFNCKYCLISEYALICHKQYDLPVSDSRRQWLSSFTITYKTGVGNLFCSGSHKTYTFLIVFPWEPYNIFQQLMQLIC